MKVIKRNCKRVIGISLLLSCCSVALAAGIGDKIKATPPYKLKSTVATPMYISGLTPAQVTSGYGFNSITNQGQGQVIAIIDAYDDPNAEADLGVFSSTFNLPACTTANGCFQKIYASGTQPSGSTAWGIEISLDIQWAHAIAPQAKIMLVEAADSSFTSLFQAINVALKNGATVVSMSWGSDEFTGEESYDSTFNIPNMAFTAAAGDSGTGIWYPAVSPYVIGVGGTTLNISSTGQYIGETAWSGSGGGISTIESEPSYQLNFSIPNNPNKFRGVPDVAYGADPNTGFAIYDSYGYGGWLVIGGTSAGAPQWAALIAIANSLATSKLTDINAMLYTIATNNYSSVFHDITTGSNGTCGVLCNAAVGYDYVTGIGSPQAGALITAISGTIPPPHVSVTISPITATLLPGGVQQFTATVTGSSNTNVTWAATCGTVNTSGFYTAPTTTANCTVTTTSVADTTKSASATVTVATQSPAQQLQADFRTTRLGGHATCTATSTQVTCQVPSSTQLVDNSQPNSVLDTMVAQSVTTIQNDVIKVNPTSYAQLTCQLQNGSVQYIPHGASQKYAVFTAACQSPLPFP